MRPHPLFPPLHKVERWTQGGEVNPGCQERRAPDVQTY
jgi:hypothetical protein